MKGTAMTSTNLERRGPMAVVPVGVPAVAAQQYLIFSLGGEAYAVGTQAVREIIEYGQLTAVPLMPAYIRGVINLRGAVVPVIDLAARFGRPATDVGKRTCIVIVEVTSEAQTQVLGVVVDAVSAVRQMGASDIEPPPAFGARIRSDFIQGMAKVQGQFVILLDVGRVLSMDEIAVLSQIGQDHPVAASS